MIAGRNSTADVRAQVGRVLWLTLILNMAVAVGKIVLGLLTGALAITADGFHSVADGAGNVAGLIANHYAAKPPDDEHPYGHRRFETMAALLIGGLLLLTAWEVAQAALDRWQSQIAPDITPPVLVILGLTLVVNVFVSRYQTAQGRRLRSEILLADARNTRADVFVTLSVIISSVLVVLTGQVWIDVIAALIVILLIVRAALQIVRETGRVLVDTAPYAPQDLAAALADLPGGLPAVQAVRRVRSRGTADAASVDLDVIVTPHMTAEQGTRIAETIRGRLRSHFQGLNEVAVRFSADADAPADPALAARAHADTLGLTTHEVLLGQDSQGTLLELHVEVPAGTTLAQAHARVSDLEARLQRDLPHIDRVVTHIEPMTAGQVSESDPQRRTHQAQADALAHRAGDLLRRAYDRVDWHDICARPTEAGYALVLHAGLPANISLEAAHDLAEDAETLLRASLDGLTRVTIHTEPTTA